MRANVIAALRSRTSSRRRTERIAATTMITLGALILGMWAAFIAGGVLDQGLRTVENNQYLIFHLAAETVMGALLILGGAGLLRRSSWAYTVAFLGLGMTVYSTINSLSHSVRNEPSLTPILIASMIVAVAIATMLGGQRLDNRTTQ
jgi:peptidoglycan/LPS O-acetylase OafA/YrhL